MATVVHNDFRDGQLGAPVSPLTTVDFDADAIDVSLLDQTDSGAIVAATKDYGAVDTADVVADRADSSDVPLLSKTVGVVATGVFDAADVTFTTITGDAADYLVLYHYNATPANAALIITWDSATTGLPVNPNGGDITVTFNGSGILQL